MEPQAALEQAVVNAILAASFGYVAGQVGRTLDGRPPPSCGQVYVAVWSEGDRISQSKACLDEVHSVIVTVSERLGGVPFDRWAAVRDSVEARLNRIRALLHRDVYNWSVTNAASVLAGLEPASPTDNAKRVGFRGGLSLAGIDRWQLVGGEWFWAKPGDVPAGLAQQARFAGARRVQAMATMA